MTRTEYKVVFTALGFLAVILRDMSNGRQSHRAAAIADLIESFCVGAVPEAFAREAVEPS